MADKDIFGRKIPKKKKPVRSKDELREDKLRKAEENKRLDKYMDEVANGLLEDHARYDKEPLNPVQMQDRHKEITKYIESDEYRDNSSRRHAWQNYLNKYQKEMSAEKAKESVASTEKEPSEMTPEEFHLAVKAITGKLGSEMSPKDIEPSNLLIAVLKNVTQPPPAMGGLGPDAKTKKMLIDAGYVGKAKAKQGRLTEKGRNELDQLKRGIRPIEEKLYSLQDEISSELPVSSADVDAYNIKLPESYIKRGESYVHSGLSKFKQSAPLKPEAEKKEPASASAEKDLAVAEKNHNRLKKLGTTEATKEFGSYPKYIDALKETRLKLNDAKADHEDSLSGETKEPTKEEIQKIREKDIKDIMSTKEKRIKEAEENHEKLKKLGSVEFDTYAEYTKALSNSRLEVNEAKSDHASMAKNVARAERDWKDIPSDWKTEDEDSVPDEAKEPEKKSKPVEEKPKAKEPWEMTPDTPQSESPVNAPVDALVQYITGDRLNDPAQFRNLYYKLSDPDRVAVAKELNKRGLLHEIDARKKKPMDASTIINSARGQYRNRYYDSKTEYEDFLSGKAKVTEKKPEVEKEKPKAKEPWEISEREYGEQERQRALTSLREDLRKAKSGEEEPNVFLNGAKSKAALIRTREKDIEDAKYTKPERYSGNHLGFINKAIREGKDVPQANLDRYDIKTEKPAESAKEPEKVAVTPSKEPVAAETGAKGKQVEQMTPEQSAATAKFRIGDGWKLHLNVPEDANDPLTQAISKTLTDLGVNFKVGRNSGQAGKGMTVYVGSKDAAKAIAARLENEHTLPAGINLPEDARWSQGVNARFDIGSANRDYHQYGFGGTPVLKQDVMDAWGEPGHGFTAANASKAHQALAKLYGSFYTGPSAPAPIPKPTTATPPKEPVAEAKEVKEKPKPTHWKDYHEPIASKLEKSPKTKEKPGLSWHWPPRPEDAPTPEGLVQKKTKEEKPAEVKEMKEKPKQKEFDLTDTPKAKEEKPVEAKKVEDAPKEKAKGDITPEQDVKIRSEHKKLDKLMDRARESGRDPEDMKAVKEQKKVVDDLLVEANLDPLAKSQEGVLQNRVRPLPKYTVNGGASSLRQIGTNKSKEERAKKAEDRMAKVEANIKEAQANRIKEDKEFAETSATNLKTDSKGTPTTNPGTGKGADLPGDQEAGGGVPPPKKELNKVQIGQIYKAKEEYDESLKNLRAVKKGDKLERKKQYDTYIGARKNLSNLRVKVGRKALPRTGPINELGEHDGLDEDMIQGVEEHKKAQEEQTASRKPVDQAQVPVALDPVAAEFMKGQESTPGKGPMEAGYKEWEESRPPAPAPVQRVEPTVTPPRIENKVGSTSPLPQTQPAPVAPIDDFIIKAGTTPVPNATQDAFNAYLAAQAGTLKTASAGTAPVPAAPAPQAQVQPAPVPQPQTQAQPAGAAPVAPAPWFPLGPGKGQVTWPPQPTAGVAPAPAPSGRGSQAASQAAAASGAKPVDQGQFAPSKPQPQQQPEAPAPAPWFPFGQGNGQAPWPPQNDQAIPAPVPQPVPPAPAPAPAPSGDELQKAKQAYSDFVNRSHADNMTKYGGRGTATSQYGDVYEKDKTALQERYKAATLAQGMPWPPNKQPAPAPAPAQPSQQPAPGQPQQKPGTPQPKPPFNPFQRTEPTPAQPKPKPPFNPFQRIEDKVAPRTSRPKQQPETKTQPAPVPVPVPVPVPQQPMSRLEKVKKALASVGQGIGQAATNASQSVQRVATHGITKAVLAHLGVAALHGINYHKAIKNLGPKQPRKFNPGWHGFTTPVGKPEDEAKAAEQQKAAPEPKEAAEPKTSGKWERRDR